ncbi:hypothetical protein DM02DRAFT_655611 [Periconia macrospinosa]|uniref:RING-type domain-containing protein n=1 Tax=Periconia macrospinosa TaxID=97972 RepID=A0A2V1DSR2_9PLEO|nr:hypothetical protein DM02DRAFT_655611 [Periconia macrospinosa]
MNTTRAPSPSPPRAAVSATPTPMATASTTSTPPPVSSRPASARPKNSSSSIASSATSSHMPSGSSNGKSRGTTPSASRSSLKAGPGEPDRPARAASKDSLNQKMAKKPEDSHKQPSKSEEQLKVLKSDFDGLRSHLTCKICDRLLYQPYTIACGHTYCYSCLCTWFVNNKSRKTCPDCRTAVTNPPAPAYIIRDMTSMFIARAELLPAGETVEQHKAWSQEEADAVQQDKDNTDRRNGGLFKACFRSQLPLGPPLHAIRDQDDGVDRCPVCSWELEDSECIQCGLLFDDNGELTWTDSFNGFSDMDEMSEQDMESGEDLDADMDMEDPDFDGLGPEGWGDYYPDEVNFSMQRFLGNGLPPQAGFARRRPLSHSEAGSRRLYSPSLVSDMYTDDMDTVQEEEEEGMDEDSSMNDFIEDDEHEPETGTSQSGSSTLSQTPQPSGARAGLQARNRRVVESESSSTISSVAEEEEEDEEDQGPIRRGQRNRAHTRILNRANGSQESNGPPSSTSTDASMDEEETQALLQAEGWFQHNGMDEQGEDDEDDGSDGGRTTVGWDATAISNDRIRMGGSLTPTADRPRLNSTIRPPSRVGNPLRQRPSLLPSPNLNYEDGEADDDDSDPDHDGDINMAMRALRSRRSRAQMRNAATFRAADYRLSNRDNAQGAEQDDHSDTSESGGHRRPHQEYNPRISRLFADHQRALMELQRGGPLLDLEPRSITPITRPRTSNRNRPSPAQAYSPFMAPAPARLRTPNMNHSSNTAATLRSPASPPRRNAPPSSLLEILADANTSAQNHSTASSVSSGSAVPTPSTSSASSRASTVAPDAVPSVPVETGDRPPSRVSARPPSAAGRRTPGFSPVYANFPHTNVGLNIQGRIFPHQVMGNPWGAFVQPRNVRTRNSRQMLREQSSTATLRAPNSRINLREGLTSPQGVRPQPSRVELRSQPSRRRLNPQNSTRTLRASEHARPPQSPVIPTSPSTSSAPRPSRLTQEETSARARELVNNRLQALGQSNVAPSRNNPFVQGFRRPTTTSASPVNAAPATGAQHIRSNSNESNHSGSSHATAPASPGLARRRSSRHMAAAASGALPQPLGVYQAPAGAYNNNYFRSRQNSIGSSAFDVPLDGNARGISPMMVTSLI